MSQSFFRAFWASGIIVALSGAAQAARTGGGADWPQWRGPNSDGVSTEKGWRADWRDGRARQLWKTSVGVGYSAVAVKGERLYTMGLVGDGDTVWCLDAENGKEVWQHHYRCPRQPKGGYPGPRATPTVDDGLVYTLSHEGHVFCLRADSGQVVWSKHLSQELRLRPPEWGFAGSPTIEGQLVLFNVGNGGVALEKRTGRVVWNSGEGRTSYSTPLTFAAGGQRFAAMFTARGLLGVDPATGKKLWEHPWKTSYDANIATPIIAGGHVFISSGYNVGCAMLRLNADRPAVVWQNKHMRNHFNTCVLWENHLYGFDESTLKCLDFRTGAMKWAQNGLGKASLMIADGKLLVLSERGELVVAPASPAGFRETARARVLGGRCWTVPVLCGGRVYCRNEAGDLVCVDASGP